MGRVIESRKSPREFSHQGQAMTAASKLHNQTDLDLGRITFSTGFETHERCNSCRRHLMLCLSLRSIPSRRLHRVCRRSPPLGDILPTSHIICRDIKLCLVVEFVG